MTVLAEADAGIALIIRERCENPRLSLLQAFTASHVADEIASVALHGTPFFIWKIWNSIHWNSLLYSQNYERKISPSHKSLRILMEELIRFDKSFFDLITTLERLGFEFGKDQA